MTEPLYLPQITIVAITDRDHGKTIEAILKTLEIVKPLRTIFFSDVYIERPEFETIVIPPLRSAKAYNEFVTWKLYNYITSSHILLIQHDGYVIDASAWTDEFLEYDYIGAPWTYTDGRNVGNGGFSLRSTKLHDILATDPTIEIGSPEDEIICRYYRGYLESKHGIRYAPESLAHRFSFEMHRPLQRTFGFHNTFHTPYKEPIILKRNHAMGDIIMLEPVMEYFHKKGYRVILDTLPHFFNLFQSHHYPVEHVAYLDPSEDTRGYRVINFDMAYEVTPKQLALKSYFEVAGITDYELRNSKLNFKGTPQTKLFDKYAVIHVNHTDMPWRNLVEDGWNWSLIVNMLEMEGYTVVSIGENEDLPKWYKINAVNESMLAYIVGGADLFIGSDSGPAQLSVSAGVKSIIFFGSVNPKFRYHDFTNIVPLQGNCIYAGCYHETVGVRGTECRIAEDVPPCTVITASKLIGNIKKLIR